ncbi:MAG: DNA polymerase III subunit alpha [Firmicutes bacterium]|nr:DNA polymerase III subunit alpha [Bacillota bacterium]
MQSFPLLNIWSAYSLLQSTWDLTVGLTELQNAGFTQAGLADYYSLAATERFEYEARLRNLHAWLGVSVVLEAKGQPFPASLYALDHSGWQELCRLITDPGQVLNVEEVSSRHLLLLLWGHSRVAWESDFPLIHSLPFGEVVEELLPSARAHGIGWIPSYPVRFNRRPGADEAYRVLTRLGEYEPSAHALAIPDSRTALASYPESWRSLLFEDKAPDVLARNASYMPQVTKGDEEDARLLREMALQRLHQWNPQPFSRYVQRLEQELAVITQMGFSSYFLIVEDLVHFATDNHIAIGPGRGSAAGSLVARVLGITRVDPIKYGLIFERFLNPHRRNLPDIDLDVDSLKRHELIAYLRRRWGRAHVAQIGTYGTLGARAVLRDVARIFQIPIEQVDKVLEQSRLVSGMHLAEGGESLRERMMKVDPTGQWWKISRLLEGLPRHASIHAAGVVLSSRSLEELIPCSQDGEGNLVTQMDMASVERLGLLKLDLLGLRTLSVLDRIHRRHDDQFDTVDPTDPRTLKLLGRGDTDAIFQLDGKGVRQLLQRLKPQQAKDIIDVVALYRPGPMDTIETYLLRRRGSKEIPQDILGRLCRDTFGVMLYQEQLMMLVREVAGYSLAEADLFRRAVSKKDHESLREMAVDFAERCQAHGLQTDETLNLWQRILAFGDYGFNKSHAAAYGLLSYYMAFLKSHYPLDFWAAEFSTVGTERLGYEMTLAVSQGIVVHPPDIRYSGQDFHAVDDDVIVSGLSLIRGMNLDSASQIEQERQEGGPYQTRQEAYNRIIRRLGQRVADLLEEAGCLALLPGTIRHPKQMEFFSDSPNSGSGSRVVNALRSFGFRWPHAVGPIYVRVTGPVDVRWWHRTLSELAKTFPGSCGVVVGNKEGQAHRFDSIMLEPTWKSLDAIRQLPEVAACGRRVESKERWPI